MKIEMSIGEKKKPPPYLQDYFVFHKCIFINLVNEYIKN